MRRLPTGVAFREECKLRNDGRPCCPARDHLRPDRRRRRADHLYHRSTGSPKPALLSHRNITVQNMCMCGSFFGGDSGTRTLVNLPPSHVGGQTETMMSTFFGGGTVVLLDLFDASRSLRAIARHRVQLLGQIPAMFNWSGC